MARIWLNRQIIMLNFAVGMKIMKNLLIFCMLFVGLNLLAQDGQSWNQTDADGRRTGPWKGYYPGGQVRYLGQFEKNRAVDTFYYYFEDSKLKSILIHDPDTAQKVFAMHFYSTGDTLAKGTYINQKKQGIWITYGEGSVPVEVGSYKNDQKHGKWTIYYTDGVISEVIHYQEGIENGPYKTYFENGQIRMDAFYLNGALHGQVSYYEQNGKKEKEGEYVEGLRDGKWLVYDKNELVVKLLRYEGGKLQNPEDLDSTDYNQEEFMNRRKDYLEFEDLRGKIKYE